MEIRFGSSLALVREGLASASFYVPFRRVRGWSWETYWLTGGVMSWIIAPWLLAACLTHTLLHVLRTAPLPAVIWAYFFGVVGTWRINVWLDDAVSRPLTGYVRRPGVYGGF